MALPLLEAALANRPDDTAAWEAKGFALGQLSRGEEGLDAFGTALSLEPDRESTLAGAATLAARGRRVEEAIAYWLRAIKISPWRRTTRPSWPLSTSGIATGAPRPRPAGSRSASTRPTSPSARSSCGASSVWITQTSRGELETLLGFDPPDRDELLHWLNQLSRTR